MLAFRYTHPRTGAEMEIRQTVRVPRDLPVDLTIGKRLALVCDAERDATTPVLTRR